ncbi:MAG: glycosyltransferase family A protein [Clostridia bacterium]
MTNIDYFSNKDNFSKYLRIESECVCPGISEESLNVTIAIPTFGRADLLREAILSCLSQTFNEKYEILVVDNDPGTDSDSARILHELNDGRITYYKNKENIGCLPNFNRCIELARGRYIIMLHTDDLLDPEFLDIVMPIVGKHPEIDMLVPGKRILRNGIFEKQKGFPAISKYLGLADRVVRIAPKDFALYNIVGGPMGILMKREYCLELGGFDENTHPVADYAFWTRYATAFNSLLLPMELGTYRFIDNISSGAGIAEQYLIHEHRLISALISQNGYGRAMKGYLFEYIHFRARRLSINPLDIFMKTCGKPYKPGILNRLMFVWVVFVRSASYLARLISSRIKARRPESLASH